MDDGMKERILGKSWGGGRGELQAAETADIAGEMFFQGLFILA